MCVPGGSRGAWHGVGRVMKSRSAAGFGAILIVALIGVSAGCDELDAGAVAAEVEGQAWFVGAVGAGATVRLHRTDASGVRGEQLATTITDAQGRFRFSGIGGIEGEADLLVVVDLGGVPWVGPFGGSGVYDTDITLRAPVFAVASTARRQAIVTPFTTLAMAAVDARRVAGRPRPLASTFEAMAQHLTLSPIETPIDANGEALGAAGLHAALLDGFVGLAAQLGEASGAGAAAFTAPHLLTVLLDDAAGASPPGRFDGLGPAGAVDVPGPTATPLDADTLRGALVRALFALPRLAPARWGFLEPRALSPLAATLTCSTSDLFPDCAPFEGVDDTPPIIEDPAPPTDEPLTGVARIEVTVRDPESGVRDVELEALTAGVDDAPAPAEAPLDGRFVFSIDTRQVQGEARLELVVRARNHAGLVAELSLDYAVSNRGSDQLAGFVVKGPAAHVVVEARSLDADDTRLLARAVTDTEGRFTLDVPEWDEGVLLVARSGDDPTERSSFLDEARGRSLRWREQDTLVAALPSLAEAQGQPVIVSPLTDLAWHLAQARALQRGGGAVLTEYRAALEALGAHFGLVVPYAGVLHRAPAPFDVPGPGGLGDAERAMIALACLSQQALELALALHPDDPDRFTALDLVALYRDDVAADGALDGRLDQAPLEAVDRNGRAVALPLDPFRHDLARACHAWLVGPTNGAGIDPIAVVDDLQALATNDDPVLFGTGVAPTPFDDAPPTIDVEVETTRDAATPLVVGSDGALTRPDGRPVRVRGQLRLQVTASDATGVVGLEVLRPSGTPADALTVDVTPALPTLEPVSLTARLQTEQLADGAHTLRLRAEDALGHATLWRLDIAVDNHAPTLRVERPADGVGVDTTGRWHTARALLPIRLVVDDVDPEAVSVSAVVGADLLAVRGAGAERDLTLALPAGREGPIELQVTATDAVGHRTAREQTIVVDRTAPSVAVRRSSYVDELPLGFPRHLPGAARAYVDPNDGELRKWQTTWGPDDPNLAPVSLTITDAASSDAALVRAWRSCVGANCRLGAPRDFEGDRVELFAGRGGLDFDPIGAPPPVGTPVSMRFEVTDLAGNTGEVDNQWRLNVLPPPVVIEEVAPVGVTWDDLSFEDDSVARFLQVGVGHEVAVRRVRLENPHRVPVRVRIQAPAVAVVRAERTLPRVLVTRNVAVDPPACWRPSGAAARATYGSHFVAAVCIAGCTTLPDPCRAWPVARLPVEVHATARLVLDDARLGAPSVYLEPDEVRDVQLAWEVTEAAALEHLAAAHAGGIPGAPDARYAIDVQGTPGVWYYSPPPRCIGGVACVPGWQYGRQLEALGALTVAAESPMRLTGLRADEESVGRTEVVELPALEMMNATVP